ncbi:MAG: hypothetical protein J6J38_07925 [Lachnospiraceae bacterium]|nr:hypothetical protein [Lachnospiraceae bacterium]
MNQIYNFNEHTPPVLTERMLQDELARRTLRRQTRLLRIASLLVSLCFLLCGVLLFSDYTLLAIGCLAFVILSLVGNGIISFVFYKSGSVPE